MPHKSTAGRKTVMTKRVLGKLEHAFAMGCNDREACLYAKINPDTLYTYQNSNPEFSEQKKMLKQTPIFKARKTILKHLNDPKIAMWYLERKAKEEFNLRHIATEPPMEPELTEQEKEEYKKLFEQEGIPVEW